MIELKHVSFAYGSENSKETAENRLHDVDLTIREGEFVLLTGPSGCGKTTILRLINGLIPQFYPGTITGEVLVNGENVSTRELYDTAGTVGTVFQNPRTQFYNVDTTSELAFGCENRGLPAEEIYARLDRSVEAFHAEALMDRNIFRLSDGEKQRIACASVDVSGLPILLLDEPSANLDYAATMDLRATLLRWKRQGKTIVAAEHRIAYLWDLIDRALILREGRIVRELDGAQCSTVTPEELTDFGLRTNVLEQPEDIPLPALLESDEPVTVRGLRFGYRASRFPILDIPAFSFARREITAVVGHNGAGKTTLLQCLCGIEKRCRAVMEYAGGTYNRRAREKLCFMVMQDTGNQLFTQSVLEEVLISFPKGTVDAERKAAELLRELDLEALADRHPQSLSGGQKQRLAIAGALASGREILLFDEPTSGLDLGHMRQTAKLLNSLRERGITLLVVTHDCELIRECCTRKQTIL